MHLQILILTVMNYPNYHVITVKYLGTTNHRGSRVKLTSRRFNQSVVIPFDYVLNNIEDMAAVNMKINGFNIVGIAEGFVITDTFQGFNLAACKDCTMIVNASLLSGVERCPKCTTKWIKS